LGLWDRIKGTLGELGEELLPGDLRDRVDGARELLARGHHGAAAAALEQALLEKPDHATALYLLGAARLGGGDPARAAAAFEKALAVRPGWREALAGLGEARRRLGEHDAAIVAFRQVLGGAGGDRETLADAYRGLGLSWLALGARDKGVRELRKALAEDPGDVEAAAALADALLAGGADPEEARGPLERAGRAADTSTPVLLALARLELRAGRLAEAEKALARAGESDDVETLTARAELALRQGDPPVAHALLLRALAAAPSRADLHLRLAAVHRAVANTEAALAAYDIALDLGADARAEALETALASGRLDIADRHAQELLRRVPDHARALAARGMALAAAGDDAAARPLLERAGDLPEARLALAELDLAAAPARAAEAARAVLRLRPGDARARELVARAVTRELGADKPAGDVYALAGRVHAATLARRELGDLAADAARVVEAYDRPLLITVMGEFSSGKSTFVNALLGAEIAPVGITPTTATINIAKYGRERRGRVVYEDDRERELRWDELGAALSRLGADEARRIRHVEVLYPLDALERVNIVDTPGLNSILPEHEATARRFIAEADAVVWLFTVGQAGKATEREALERIRAEGKRVLGVVNKIDQASPEDAARIVAHTQKELGPLVDALVPVSARRALAARQAGDAAALAASGWPALEAALEERFFQNARVLKRDACVKRLGALLAAARARADAAAEAAGRRAADLDAAATALRADAAILLRGVLAEEARALAERLSHSYRDAAREVLELVRPRRTPFGANQAQAADRDYLVRLLERALAEIVEPTRQRVEAELRRAAPAAAGATELVLERFRAYLRGYLHGGHVDDFFARALPRLELDEDSVYHALVRDAPDLERELVEPLAARVQERLAALAAELDARAGAADDERHEAEAGLRAALAAFEAQLAPS
jgi:small GTP-binding protein